MNNRGNTVLPFDRTTRMDSPGRQKKKNTPLLQRFSVILALGALALVCLLVTIYHGFNMATNHVSSIVSNGGGRSARSTMQKFGEDGKSAFGDALLSLERLHQHNTDTHIAAKDMIAEAKLGAHSFFREDFEGGDGNGGGDDGEEKTL